VVEVEKEKVVLEREEDFFPETAVAMGVEAMAAVVVVVAEAVVVVVVEPIAFK
jgi:hypothetical protein